MKSFVVLASILYLGVVVSAIPDLGLKSYLHTVPANVMAKCLKESNLEADKDKLLADPSAVDPAKLSCLFACTGREDGILVNGKLQYDVLVGVFSKLLTKKEDRLQEKLDLLKVCILEGANSKNDCEYVLKILQCQLKKATELGL